MGVDRTLRKHAATYSEWKKTLEGTDGDVFGRDPGERAWKLGEVCDHVLETSRAFLDQAEALARGARGEERRGGVFAAIMSTVGTLPPMRVKVPTLPPELSRIAQPEGLGKEEALRGFAALDERTRALAPEVAAAPRRLRAKHPVLGWFNAAGWFQLSEMHLRHHLRQLRRMRKALEF